MNIDQLFNNILVKYRIIEETSYETVNLAFRDSDDGFSKGLCFAIYGMGWECETILPFIENHTSLLQFSYCFDASVRCYKYGRIVPKQEVYPIDRINEFEIDVVYICARIRGDELRNELERVGFEGQIFEPFKMLETYISNRTSDYQVIHRIKKEIREGILPVDKGLRLLIKNLLLIKDFVSAERYIKDYVSGKNVYWSQYENAWKEISELLETINEHIHKRKCRDIIINWVDAISYYDKESFLFLKEQSEKGTSFENTYTVMPWTTETMKSILYGEYLIEGKLFLVDHFSEKKSPFKEILDKYDYKMGYCGFARMAKKFWKDVECPLDLYESSFAASTINQWNALSILCKETKPVCIFIHNLRETHEPFVSVDGDTCEKYRSTTEAWEEEGLRQQSRIADEYIDSQLRFYNCFYNNESIRIYMSDHGRRGNSPTLDDKIHTFLFVVGKGVPKRKEYAFFSLCKFDGLIKKIIEQDDEWSCLFSEYVWIQNLDAYNPRVVRETIKGIFPREDMTQCRGIVTDKDSYYVYKSGDEHYYPNRFVKKNEINNPSFKNRINELKKLCGDEFIDINKYEKFKYSRALYDPTLQYLIE